MTEETQAIAKPENPAAKAGAFLSVASLVAFFAGMSAAPSDVIVVLCLFLLLVSVVVSLIGLVRALRGATGLLWAATGLLLPILALMLALAAASALRIR